MTNELLLDRLQSAIRKRLSSQPSSVENTAGQLTGYLSSWRGLIPENEVSQTEYTDADLLTVFKNMWSKGIVGLAKYNDTTGQWVEYSGHKSDDSAFFLNGQFRAKIK